MDEYPHIDTIWKRDMANKGQIILEEYASPELEYLSYSEWIGTEKVDGTNIRVMWDGTHIEYGGKTNNAQIPAFLVSKLRNYFDGADFANKFSDSSEVCLYGEGYGARIQKGGGNYNSLGVDFVLFDVKVGEWWLRRPDIEDVAHFFNLKVVPIVFTGTLLEANDKVRLGIKSTWGDFDAEGLVLKPSVELLKRNGERIITKIKQKDFKGLK